MTAPTLEMPDNMVDDTMRIFRDAEYDVPVSFMTPPRILDCGACVGAFADWASVRWRGARITCVEPNPAALVHLRKNLPDGATLIEAAIAGSEPGFVTFFDGAANLGCAGLAPLADSPESIGKEGFQVASIPASSLPLCEILKADMEGAEMGLLEGYDLSATVVCLVEFHRKADRRAIEDLLEQQGFELYSALIRQPWLGTLRFLRKGGTT